MTALTKRNKAIRAKVDRSKAYALKDALTLVKETATAKFDGVVLRRWQFEQRTSHFSISAATRIHDLCAARSVTL